MDTIHKIIDNEGKKVEVVYTTGDHERVNIEKLLVHDGYVGALITTTGGNSSYICTYDFDGSTTGSLEVHDDPELIHQFQREGTIPHQSIRSDCRIVEVNELE